MKTQISPFTKLDYRTPRPYPQPGAVGSWDIKQFTLVTEDGASELVAEASDLGNIPPRVDFSFTLENGKRVSVRYLKISENWTQGEDAELVSWTFMPDFPTAYKAPALVLTVFND